MLCRVPTALSQTQQMFTAGILAAAGGWFSVSLVGLHALAKQEYLRALDNSSGLFTESAAAFSHLLSMSKDDCLQTMLTGAAAGPFAPCLASAALP